MIYFIRHGEAAARWGDHPNPSLSEAGFKQAERVASWLADKDIQSIVSSPMQRCQDTAAAFSKASGLPVKTEAGVTEIPTPNDVTDRVTWLRELMSGSWNSAPPIVTDWREQLITTTKSLTGNTAVFSHFVAINAIVGYLENTDTVTVVRPDYCSVTVLELVAGGLKLIQKAGEAETKIL
ncbi:MAG: histidine phosphatase family protein [Pseudomonadota bacterium]